jgi:hypothetical protein
MTRLDTHLTAVVVYPDRARLTRQGSVRSSMALATVPEP